MSSVYPVKASFIYSHLYSSGANEEPDKLKVCEEITQMLNEAYEVGKVNGVTKVNHKEVYLMLYHKS